MYSPVIEIRPPASFNLIAFPWLSFGTSVFSRFGPAVEILAALLFVYLGQVAIFIFVVIE